MLLCFPICNIRISEKPTEATLQTRILQLSAQGLVPKGYEEPQGFVVMKESPSPIETVPSIPSHLVSVRDLMRDERILAEEDGILVVKEDYSFNSPSTAAGVMLDRSANGRTAWKDEQSKTLKEIQATAVDKALDE